ncbi:N-acetylmuramic acid 6-phosphate etherase [Tanticharoenia sakaeratensis]|uniref:N-acetylmuramic acid 6-phosphate etherase n=1 Tax=Tanticharoenia sakaeratensis NBRC 103193 TaxID=1231623 RepID=A0A0D6MMI5_9PROT|nr:N-acetylmuramic acid 6-phosphate etherase [Tanticharoenia sakaeratensis]GAN54882.1 N-acetylmuramic acid 6-phosphate etherase [Tanticharoenia sakaeratensis NBRC 103193]GBQ22404.1 N-acetylmuramic acid 6-phosphate etherase [Tanticharoenia sakaeratensis NBRC 103193]
MTQSLPTTGTERHDPRYADIDLWPTGAVLDALAEAQMTATALVRAAVPEMERIVDAALPRLQRGGRLFYVGAGTSGRIGLQDGVELTPTFGLPPERLVLLLAGGTGALFEAAEGAEDREDVARAEIMAHAPGPDDVVFGIAASGGTPYTCAAVAAARAAGALTVGIACNPSGRLLREAECPLAIVTGPEVIAGSTRLKAGTAQKAALNLLSTTLMVRLGHAYRGRMVDMRVVNAKLEGRAEGMVRTLAGGTDEEIRAALKIAGNNVKRAVLIRHGLSLEDAEAVLVRAKGDLRVALADLDDVGRG